MRAKVSEGRWTVAEGVRDVVRFLLRRAPAAAVLWLVLGGVVLLWANAGTVGATGFGMFGIWMAFMGALAGWVVGTVFSKGIGDAVHFAGWIPNVAAGLASLLVVGAGWALLAAVVGVVDAHLGALVVGGAALGSLGAVARFVWAES